MFSSRSRSCILDLEHQNVCSANSRQLIHHSGDLLLLNHGANGNPIRFLERGNGGRTLTRGDFCRGGELVAGDVVLAEDVFLRVYKNVSAIYTVKRKSTYQ